MINNSQKFIARNRAPRVQIEYDVEIYGSEKKIELPFVMGVLADLSGKPVETLPPVAERKFLDIDIDNFDERMKAIQPRVAFAVPNTLTGEGQLMVDITFESIDDFSPAAIARKVEPLTVPIHFAVQPGKSSGLYVHFLPGHKVELWVSWPGPGSTLYPGPKFPFGPAPPYAPLPDEKPALPTDNSTKK